MEAMIILMAIFCASLILSRFSHGNFLLRFLFAPIFIAIGNVVSFNALGFISKPLLKDLELFTHMSLSWLCFLLGVKIFSLSFNVNKIKITYKIFDTLFGLAVNFVVLFLLLFYLEKAQIISLYPFNFWAVIILFSCLLVGRETFSKSKNKIHSFTIGFISSVATVIFSFIGGLDPLVLTVGLGGSIFLSILIKVIEKTAIDEEKTEQLVLVIIASCTMIAGVGLYLSLPHAVIIFFFGACISLLIPKLRTFITKLYLSEPGVRIVFMILGGASIVFDLNYLLAGIIVGVILSIIKIILFKYFHKSHILDTHSHNSLLGSSDIAVLFMFSIYFSFGGEDFANLIWLILGASGIMDVIGVLRFYLLGLKKNTRVKNQSLQV